jgi:subtilisin family serine protease
MTRLFQTVLVPVAVLLVLYPGENSIRSAKPGEPSAAPENLTDLQAGGQVQAAVAYVDKNAYRVLHVEFKDEESRKGFKVQGATVFAQADRFADIFILSDPADQNVQAKIIAAVKQAPGFVWLDYGVVLQAPPPPPGQGAPGKAKQVPDPIVRGGLEGGLTGKGVIIAVVDSGIDFHHPDFIRDDKDGKPESRILYFWDTTVNNAKIGKPAPVKYPNGVSVGTVYSQADLTSELRSSGPGRIDVWDCEGHGTSCASIAAGNNQKSGPAGDKVHTPVGVAPDADIIAVRIGDHTFPNDYLLAAICDWLDGIARERKEPLVVSCSFAGQHGGHDGFLVLERELDARFPDDVQGRALCIAAGNDGNATLHGEVEFGGEKDKGSLKWQAQSAGQVRLYFGIKEVDALKVTFTPAGGAATEIKPATLKGEDAFGTYFHPLRNTALTVVAIQPGAGELTVWNTTGKKLKADAYIDYTTGYTFDKANAREGKQIGSPGTTASAITVGSYDFNDEFSKNGLTYTWTVLDPQKKFVTMKVGARSFYSNPGYSRTQKGGKDVIKPEILAPGQYFTAAAAFNTIAERDSSRYYRLFNGTSAATPYTAGVIALIMQKKPTIQLGDLKQLLRTYASHDDLTGATPNPNCGHGKLTLKAVHDMVKALE